MNINFLIVFCFIAFSSFGANHIQMKTKEKHRCFFVVGEGYNHLMKRVEIFITSVECTDDFNKGMVENRFIKSLEFSHTVLDSPKWLLTDDFDNETSAISSFRKLYNKLESNSEGKPLRMVKLLSLDEIYRIEDKRQREASEKWQRQIADEQMEQTRRQTVQDMKNRQVNTTLILAVIAAVGALALLIAQYIKP